MSKVLAPLFSRDARGQLGYAIVYSSWKGLSTVRSYVVPANPNTAGQQTQRGYMADAVTIWRSGFFNAADRTAWNAWATLDPRPMSGFNEFCSQYLNVRVTPLTWLTLYQTDLSLPGAGQVLIKVKIQGDDPAFTVTAFLDTSQGGTINSQVLTWQAGTTQYEGTATGLGSGVFYWIRIRATKAGNESWIGDYKIKTS